MVFKTISPGCGVRASHAIFVACLSHKILYYVSPIPNDRAWAIDAPRQVEQLILNLLQLYNHCDYPGIIV